MEKPTTKGKSKKRRQPKGSQYIVIDAASLAFALLLLGNNKGQLERLTKLALRGPDFIKELITPFIEQHGEKVDLIMQGEPATPASKEEIIEAIKPVLKEGTRIASFVQLIDLYILHSHPTPESIIYIFYIVTRYYFAREQEPTKDQSKLIWATTLHFAQKAIIVDRHWKALEKKGAVYLEDWLDEVKETARKKFKTFLSQKRRAEKTSDKAFKRLYSFIFDNDENE